MPLDLRRDIVIRWDDPDPSRIALLKEASVNAVVLQSPNESFERACAAAGIATAALAAIEPRLITEGLWPGISAPPNVRGRGDETASASREPWVDSNGYLVAYQRALHPDRPAVMAYLPNEDAGLKPDRLVPFDTLELALVEARVSGGNYVLALEPRYREALVSGDAKARAAWRRLGQTAAWLQKNAALFRQPTLPTITQLVDESEQSAEIANLLFRRHASPVLMNVASPPPPEPDRRLAVVAARIRPPSPNLASRILAHAEAGASVIVDAPGKQAWWRHSRLKPLRSQEDRDFFRLGKGEVVAYKQEIVDVSEFALDVIDIVTHNRRPVRLWNAPSVIPLACGGPRLVAVNYGSPIDNDIQARLQGIYSQATLVRPEKAGMPLPVAKRGTTTEVQIPEIDRLAVVVFG